MQYNNPQGDIPRAKMSDETSSADIGNRGPHIIITIEETDAIINPELTPNTSTNRCNNPNHPKRIYVGQLTNLEFVNDADKQQHQINNSPHKSEVTQPDLLTGETRTPHQTYDSKGNCNFHENSEGVVLTTPSGHHFAPTVKSRHIQGEPAL